MDTVVIGIGNEFRRDDAAGIIAARQLRKKAIGHVTVVEQSGEGIALMEAWKGASEVILIDAVQSGDRAGTVHRLDAHEHPIPRKFFHYSTHAFSVAEAIELARALNRLPSKLVVYGIEGSDFGSGIGQSEEVEIALNEVVDKIVNEIRTTDIK